MKIKDKIRDKIRDTVKGKVKDKVKDTLKHHKKRVIIIFILVLIMVAIIAAVLFLWFGKQQSENNFRFGNWSGGRGNFAMSGDMIAASGVTSVGVTEESFEVENLATELEIEEVYITSESEVTEGSKVLKLSEESVAEAREELEQALKKAELAYRAGAIEYEQSKITAEYDRDSKLLGGEQAKAVYDETIAGLQDAVDKAREEVTTAKEDIAEYQSYVLDGSYSEYFELDKYEAIYNSNLDTIEDKMEEWGVEWTQITGQGGMSNTAGSQGGSGNVQQSATVSGGDAQGAATQNTGEKETASASDIQTLSSMYKILENNMKDWKQAQSDYDNAVINAALDLQTLELTLPGLEQALAEAKEKYEMSSLQAKLTYETSLANAESAESDYETALQKAESDYEGLKDDWEDAKENLELFESSVGDGYFYASGSGTILRTMVRAGQKLTSEGIIFFYSNPEELTVTVSVNQTDISKLALGDSAYIQSSEYGSFEGTITEINPVSTSNSRTSVTYDVIVTLSGDTNDLPANESVTVVFGMEAGAMPWNGERPQGNRNGAEDNPAEME